MIEARENGLDAVNPGSRVGCRDAGDVGDFVGALTLEVEQHHLAVERREAVHEFHEAFDLKGAIGIVSRRQGPGIIERNPAMADRSADVGRGGVVGDSVDPGFERAAVIEGAEALPEGGVDFLQEVLARGVVGFIGRGEACERRAEVASAAGVEVGLSCAFGVRIVALAPGWVVDGVLQVDDEERGVVGKGRGQRARHLPIVRRHARV